MKGLVLAIGALALVSAATAAPAAEETLRARGNEPSWLLTLSGDGVTFDAPGQDLTFKAPSFRREVVDGHPHIIAGEGERTLEAKITERMCADTMSGMPFPVGVEVTFAGKQFTGCGGEIMTAIEGGWRVIRLGDGMPPEGVTVTIAFAPDGTVSGSSGCNRFTGSYTLSGEGLTFGDMASTRMACPMPQMETEQRFLDLLAKITRATPGDNAQLRLMAGDDQAMVLDRAD
jgi:heat shock protein HslJ/uncharacterized membrane protein